MQILPYRTNTTWLSDDDLILLDVLFGCDVEFSHLLRDIFHLQWNLGYVHNFDDDQLRYRLRWLCEHSVLEFVHDDDRRFFRMTARGDALWSKERCPVWERFCTERYTRTSNKRTMMTVVAVSPQIRDDFLRLWPMYPARRRKATISDYGLIPRRSFSRLHVGIATYTEENRWTPEEYLRFAERYREYEEKLERERTWWRSVDELQKFIVNAA